MYGVTSDGDRTNHSMVGNEDVEAVDVTADNRVNLRKDKSPK